jgi:uncharacterized protein DUF4129
VRRGNRPLLLLVCAGMELSYLFAGATFFTELAFHRTFPFPEAVGSFLVAFLLTAFTEGRGWRVIYVLGVQSLGFVPALFTMVGVYQSWSDSFLSQTWLTDSIASPSSVVQYAIFVLLILWVLLFWAGGTGLAGRQNDYYTLCSRFDRGLAVFFVLFLTNFYLQAVQGIRVVESTAGSFILPFLILSLLAIGMARNWNTAQPDFIPGYKTLGVLFGFVMLILLAGTGVVLFVLPYMTTAAQRGNDVFATVTNPLVSTVFAILGWLFGTDFAIMNSPSETTPIPNSTANASLPWWIEFLGRIFAGGVAVMVALVIVAFFAAMLFSVILWLLSKTPSNQTKLNPLQWVTSFVLQLLALVNLFWLGLVRRLRGYDKASHLYAALRNWGRHSGLPYFLDETPAEYGGRLARRFPILGREIESIIDAFNREVYGETILGASQLISVQNAWRRLSSPRQWLRRLKSWVDRQPDLSRAGPY